MSAEAYECAESATLADADDFEPAEIAHATLADLYRHIQDAYGSRLRGRVAR